MSNLIAFDTEFIEDGRIIDLLSIGLVRLSDGAEYYAEPEGVDLSRANPWVQKNVLPNLTGNTKARADIASEIVDFAGVQPQFWGWYASYDWVALCQLYGTMMDLPPGWPMFVRDLKQTSTESGFSLSQDDSNHNALEDARWLADQLLTTYRGVTVRRISGPRNSRGRIPAPGTGRRGW